MCILLRSENDKGEVVWEGIRCVEILGFHFEKKEKNMLFFIHLQNLKSNNYLEILLIGNTKLEILEPSLSLRHQNEPKDSCILSSVYEKGFEKTEQGLKQTKALSPWDSWYDIKEEFVTLWPQGDNNATINSFEIIFPNNKKENIGNCFPFKVWKIGPFTEVGSVIIALRITFSGDTFQRLATDHALFRDDGPKTVLKAIKQTIIPHYTCYGKGKKNESLDYLNSFHNYINFHTGYDLIFLKPPYSDYIITLNNIGLEKAPIQPKPTSVAERFLTLNPFYQINLRSDQKARISTQENMIEFQFNQNERNQVFISYSHRDDKWHKKLLIMLAPLIRDNQVDIWSDEKITPGSDWKKEIAMALSRAKVAVLIVSEHFLASKFIADNELPPILDAAEKGGLRIIWIYVRACLFEETAIVKYHAAHDPLKSLESMKNPQQQEVLKNVCELIKKYVA